MVPKAHLVSVIEFRIKQHSNILFLLHLNLVLFITVLPMTTLSSIPGRAPHIPAALFQNGQLPLWVQPHGLISTRPPGPTVSPGEAICSTLELLLLFSCEKHPNKDDPAAHKY